MNKLVCDICGTTYSEDVDRCPTCGYSRAFLEEIPEDEPAAAPREKVRGGRFSKKNVLLRLKRQEETGPREENPNILSDLEAELGVSLTAISPETGAAADPEPEEVPGETPAAEESAEAVPVPIMEAAPAEMPEEAPAEIPAEEPAEDPAQVQEDDSAAEEPAGEAEIVPVPVMEEAPVEAEPIPEEPAAEGEEEIWEEEKEAERPKRRVLIFLLAGVCLAAVLFLAVRYGVSALRDRDMPTEPAASTGAPTTAPTDAPTQAPTEPTTVPPTDPPTAPPTEPPTVPPTQPPTEPLLDVPLELNYYDLTFGEVGQTTQLVPVEIPREDITWSSEDEAIATISETGRITAVSPGQTTVHAVYGDQEVTVKITVR